MKNFLLILLGCAFGLLASAGPISQQEALNLAQRYLRSDRTVMGIQPRQEKLTLIYECRPKMTRSAGGNALYYVFNRGAEDGFVVVAGDDRIQPILAHTEEGAFDKSGANPAFKWWLGAVEQTMAGIMAQPEGMSPVAELATPGKFAEAVAPLVTAKWNQGAPFNDSCPMDGDKRSVVGCVAVAMGQILNKWEYPLKSTGGVIKYTTNTKKIVVEADMDSFTFDWKNMLDTYNDSETPEQKQAVANLLYACGVAVKMDYSFEGSGSNLAPSILENCFGIDEGCTSINREYFTASEWDAILKTELSAGRPVYYSALTAEPNSGHAFVCDGYNAQGLYHINWGWGGANDGYFEMTALNQNQPEVGAPNEFYGGYNYYQSIVYGIQPAGMEGGLIPEQVMYFSDLQIENKVYAKSDKLPILQTDACTDGTGFYGIGGMGYYDGSAYRFLGGLYRLELAGDGTYYPELSYNLDVSSLPDGDYQLMPLCKADGGEIQPMVSNQYGFHRSIIPIKVSGDQVEVLDNSKDYQINLQVADVVMVSDEAYAGANCVWNVSVKNSSSQAYFGPIMIGMKKVGSKYTIVAQNNFVIEPGETKVIPFVFASPEGVTSATFAVLGQDNVILKEHEYAVTIMDTGQLQWENAQLSYANPVVYDGEPLEFTLTAKCTSGSYAEKLVIFVFPANGGGSVMGVFSPKQTVNKGGIMSANVKLNVDQLQAGNYRLLIKYQIAPNKYDGEFLNFWDTPVFSVVDIAKTGDFVRVKSAESSQYLSLSSPSASGFTPATMAAAGKDNIFYYDQQQLLGYGNGYYMNQNGTQAGANGVQSNGPKFQLAQQNPVAEGIFNVTVGDPADGKYLAADGKVGAKAVAGKFVMEKVSSLPVSVSAAGYATLYAPVALSIPADVQAYVGVRSGNFFSLSPVADVIPAKTAVILTAQPGSYDFQITAETGATYTNELEGVIATQQAGDVLTLQNIGAVGLYSYAGTYVKGFKAYLPKSKAAGVKGLRFDLGEATGIEAMEQHTKEAKVFYDLNGRRVLYPSRGVYVTGEGKKVFIK